MCLLQPDSDPNSTSPPSAQHRVTSGQSYLPFVSVASTRTPSSALQLHMFWSLPMILSLGGSGPDGQQRHSESDLVASFSNSTYNKKNLHRPSCGSLSLAHLRLEDALAPNVGS